MTYLKVSRPCRRSRVQICPSKMATFEASCGANEIRNRWLKERAHRGEHEIARIEMQCAAIKQAATKFSPPPAELLKRMARSVVLARHRGHWPL